MNRENANPSTERDDRLRFETLLADLSSKFVNLPAGEVDREIMDGQGPSVSFSTSMSWCSGNFPKAFQPPREDQTKKPKGSGR